MLKRLIARWRNEKHPDAQLNLEIDANLKRHKAIREARAEAAKRGVSTEWKRRREQCRKVFEGLPEDML